jgi:PAS domain S-box-containing protein
VAKGSDTGASGDLTAAETLHNAAQMEAIFDALGDAVISIDAQGRVLKANTSAKRMIGLDPIGLDGATALERLHIRHPDGRRFELAGLPDARALRGEAVGGERLVFTDARGQDRMVIVHAAPISTNGAIGGAVMVMQDVSEAERLVERLDRANRELSAVQGLTEAALVAQDPSTIPVQLLERLVLATQADAAAILLKEEDRLVVRFSMGLDDAAKASFSVATGEGFAGRIAAAREPQYVRDAQQDPVVRGEIVRTLGVRSMLGVPLIARDELVGVLHLDWLEEHDVTDEEVRFLQVAAERAAMVIAHARLREAGDNLLRRVETIMENTEAHLAYLDRGFDFVMVNETYARGSGHSKEELQGKNHFDVFPDEDNQAIFERCRDSGEPVQFKAKPFEHQDDVGRGTTYWDWTLAPVRDSQGAIEGFVLSLLNVTETVTQFNAARRRAKLTETANEMLTSLSVGMDPTEALPRFLSKAVQALDAMGGVVMGRHAKGWEVLAAHGIDGPSRGEMHTDRQSPTMVHVERTGQPLLVTDVRVSDHTNRAAAKRLGYGSYVTFPLSVRGTMLGALGIYWSSPRDVFAEEDVDFARRLADGLSFAFENARLFDDLRGSKERIDSILASIDDAFVALDRDFRYTFVNDKALRLMGKAREELLGETMWDVFPDTVGSVFEREYRKVMDGNVSSAFETYYPSYDMWLDVRAYSAEDGISVFYTDISERKRAERVAAEARQDMDRAQAVAKLGSWRMDTRRDVLTWSDETHSMFGVPAGARMTYDTFLAAVHPEDRQAVDDAWSAALQGAPYDIEHRIVVGDTVRWVQEQAELEFDEKGELAGGFGTVQDITERKAFERRLARERDDVEVANRLMALFFKDAGDELFDEALDILLKATASEYGVFGYMDEDGDLVCPTMSRIFDECEMGEADKCVVYKRHKWSGLWGKAVREGKTLMSNRQARVPKGHMPIENNLACAIVLGGSTIGLINLANKEGGYSEEDGGSVQGIAGRIAPVLYAWIQRRMRARERARADEEREQAALAERERRRFAEALNRINAAMNATLDLPSILQAVVEEGSAAIGAESGGVWLQHDDCWVLSYAVGRLEPMLGMGEAMEQTPVLVTAAKTGEVIGVGDVQNDPRPNQKRMKTLGFRAMLVLPLKSRGESMGIAQFNFHSSPHTFGEAAMTFARQLAASTSLALENGALYQREHRTAQVLQEGLMTPPDPIEGVRLGYLYRSATAGLALGGDFYDVFALDADRVAIVVGDVMGKGLDAVAVASFAKHSIRSQVFEHAQPARALASADRVIAKYAPEGVFVTVFYGLLDLRSGYLSYCCAGHPRPLVKSRDAVWSLSANSPVIGLGIDGRFSADEAQLGIGDLLVAYTDGLTEARKHGALYGEEGLAEHLASLRLKDPMKVCATLVSRAERWAGGSLSDDVALIALSLSSMRAVSVHGGARRPGPGSGARPV